MLFVPQLSVESSHYGILIAFICAITDYMLTVVFTSVGFVNNILLYIRIRNTVN